MDNKVRVCKTTTLANEFIICKKQHELCCNNLKTGFCHPIQPNLIQSIKFSENPDPKATQSMDGSNPCPIAFHPEARHTLQCLQLRHCHHQQTERTSFPQIKS